MSISLSPASPRTLAVGVADDPYKKYWWLILVGCAAVGAWLCAPMMQAGVGSERVAPSAPAADASGEQGLASAARGGARHLYDLTMAAAGASVDKGAPDAPDSMLYQAPADASAGAAAVGAPLGGAASGSSASLAGALKKIGQSRDPSGWNGQKAVRGFDQPQLSGGALSGLGSVSGGRGGSAGGIGAFGLRGAQVQASAGGGLIDDGAQEAAAAAGRSGMGALNRLAAQADAAARVHSGDAAAGGMSRLFDGAGARNGIAVAGGPGGAAGAYEALDEAPINLKVNPANMDSKKITAPPATPAPPSSGGSNQQMAMMVGGMLISAVAGGMIGGVGGQMVAMMGMMAMQSMMQQQQAQQQAAAQAKMQTTVGH